MTNMEGTYTGNGIDKTILNNQMIEKTYTITMVISRICNNIYKIKNTLVDNNYNIEIEEYLILADGHEFTTCDYTGNGINIFKFKCGYNKLNYNYQISGDQTFGSAVGKFILHKQNSCCTNDMHYV